jgi:hypothetical protein
MRWGGKNRGFLGHVMLKALGPWERLQGRMRASAASELLMAHWNLFAGLSLKPRPTRCVANREHVDRVLLSPIE